MGDIQELSRLMRELEDQLTACMKCGMCQAVCPLFEQTGREADVARGKLALLDGLGRAILDRPEAAAERLNRCLLCGSCAANCPSGVKVLDIFIKARAILAGYMGLSPAKRAILRGIVANPGLFDRLAEQAPKFQKVFTRPANAILGTSCARFVSPLLGGRHFKPLADIPFHRQVPELDTPDKGSGKKVGFFVGCLLDKIFPDIAGAALEVLDHHGVGVFLPKDQACCGIPAVSSGDTRTFVKLVRHNLARFEAGAFDVLLTACATCTSTIKKIWPVMIGELAPELAEPVAALAERTQDINQYLAAEFNMERADGPRSDAPKTITYHDPCHLKKSLGVAGAPRALLETHPDYRFQEMAESDWCCGMGGSFNLQYYELSAGIGEKKREHILSTGCQTVATGCPACMLQISDMLSRAGAEVAVVHPIQIYADALKRI